jgi:ankyrin repeat protein
MAEEAYRIDPWRLAAYGELQTLKECKAKKIPIDGKDAKGFSPLIWAARNACGDVLEFLVDEGCNVTATSFGGLSALHHACNKNNSLEIKILIKSKANVNQVAYATTHRHAEHRQYEFHCFSLFSVLLLFPPPSYMFFALLLNSNPIYSSDSPQPFLSSPALVCFFTSFLLWRESYRFH